MRERINIEQTKLRDIPDRTGNTLIDEVVEVNKAPINNFLAVATGSPYRNFDFFDRESFVENIDEPISNPVYVIEYLLRKYTNFEIDVGNFDETASMIKGLSSYHFNFSLNEKINLVTLINELLFPWFGVLYRNTNKWRINTLLYKDTSGTINTILKRSGKENFKVYYDVNLFSRFEISMGLNYANGKYQRHFTISPEHSDFQWIGINPEQICSEIENNFGVKKVFEYNYKYGRYFYIRPLFEYYTTIKLVVELDVPLKDAIAYEIGDYVLINLPTIIPNSYNNSKAFIIVGKEIILLNNPFDPFIRLQLISCPFSGYYQ